jgi:cell division protein FtsQ
VLFNRNLCFSGRLEAYMREGENRGRKVPHGKRKTARRKPSKLAYFLLLLIVALSAVVVCTTVFFKIDTISISGKTPYSAAQVISASGIKTGTSMLRVDKAAAAKKICSSLPFVADAKITLWPMSTVKIQITLDSPKYLIKLQGKYAYVDKNMKVLDTRTDTKKYTGVITIDGVTVTKAETGSTIIFKNKTQVSTIKDLAVAIKEAGLSKITSMNVADSYQLSVVYDSRIVIVIGTSSEAEKKLGDAVAIIKSNIQSSEKGSLDVSTQDNQYTFSPS